jgi:hypothetical protein
MACARKVNLVGNAEKSGKTLRTKGGDDTLKEPREVQWKALLNAARRDDFR